MKTYFYIITAIVLLSSCSAQKSKWNDKSLSQAENAVAVSTLLQAHCNDIESKSNDDEFCDTAGKLNFETTSKTLVKIKKPKLPRPCMETTNCKVVFDKSKFLRSYFITKFESVQVVDEKGRVINELEQLIPADIKALPDATYLMFKEPISANGTLNITGYSKELGGDFKVAIDLNRLN